MGIIMLLIIPSILIGAALYFAFKPDKKKNVADGKFNFDKFNLVQFEVDLFYIDKVLYYSINSVRTKIEVYQLMKSKVGDLDNNFEKDLYNAITSVIPLLELVQGMSYKNERPELVQRICLMLDHISNSIDQEIERYQEKHKENVKNIENIVFKLGNHNLEEDVKNEQLFLDKLLEELKIDVIVENDKNKNNSLESFS